MIFSWLLYFCFLLKISQSQRQSQIATRNMFACRRSDHNTWRAFANKSKCIKRLNRRLQIVWNWASSTSSSKCQQTNELGTKLIVKILYYKWEEIVCCACDMCSIFWYCLEYYFILSSLYSENHPKYVLLCLYTHKMQTKKMYSFRVFAAAFLLKNITIRYAPSMKRI